MRAPLSMFTATEDLEIALTSLASAALGLSRDVVRLPLEKLGELLASADGVAALEALASKHDLSVQVPDVPTLARLFEDELISMCALASHRGRNIYLTGKLGLWNALWEPFVPALAVPRSALQDAERLVGWDTTPGEGASVERCVDWLRERLHRLGFGDNRLDRGGLERRRLHRGFGRRRNIRDLGRGLLDHRRLRQVGRWGKLLGQKWLFGQRRLFDSIRRARGRLGRRLEFQGAGGRGGPALLNRFWAGSATSEFRRWRRQLDDRFHFWAAGHQQRAGRSARASEIVQRFEIDFDFG